MSGPWEMKYEKFSLRSVAALAFNSILRPNRRSLIPNKILPMEWYYAAGNQQAGPVTDEQLRSLVREGRITDETSVWRDGMPDWKPYGTVKDGPLFDRGPQAQPAPPGVPSGQAGAGQAICVECGNFFPESETISYQGATVCGNCKPAFFQKVKEGGHAVGNLRYAGFWIRVVGYFLDFIVLFILSLGVGLVLGLAMAGGEENGVAEILSMIIQLGIGAGYATFFHGKYGATLGKMALGLKVVMPDGSPIGYGRAFGRFLAEILSGLILGIGYVIAAFDSEKRTLHDHICNTRVIRE